jgi:hypothetical protein
MYPYERLYCFFLVFEYKEIVFNYYNRMKFTEYLFFLINIYATIATKYCKNCKHYKTDSLFDRRPPLCLKFPIENVPIDAITGDEVTDNFNDNFNPIDGFNYDFCYIARNSPNKCGMRGKKYIEQKYYSVEEEDGIQIEE